jgi:hypothetical protein
VLPRRKSPVDPALVCTDVVLRVTAASARGLAGVSRVLHRGGNGASFDS